MKEREGREKERKETSEYRKRDGKFVNEDPKRRNRANSPILPILSHRVHFFFYLGA